MFVYENKGLNLTVRGCWYEVAVRDCNPDLSCFGSIQILHSLPLTAISYCAAFLADVNNEVSSYSEIATFTRSG